MLAGHRPQRGSGAGRQPRGQPRSTSLARFLAGAATAAVAAASAVLFGVWPGPPAGAAAAATTAAPPYLLALGGSASVGFQPTAAHPRGQPTSSGYAEDLVALEQRRWPGLTVAHLGCPGATTATMLDGGGQCRYPEGTQLGAAEAFLRDHPSTALVTVDLGFNDLLPCLRHEFVDAPCVNGALTTVHDQLVQILARIEAAAPSGAVVVGVGHYDPYLGDYVRGTGGQAFSAATLAVMKQLDESLQSAYRSAGRPMAEVGAAFDFTDQNPVTRPGLGTVPTDVARTCALTWMCDPPPFGHNPHPDDAGYRTIAGAIADAVADSSAKADGS
jgi:lysophospholipase L1-like esterase